jgi:hypothetical protein
MNNDKKYLYYFPARRARGTARAMNPIEEAGGRMQKPLRRKWKEGRGEGGGGEERRGEIRGGGRGGGERGRSCLVTGKVKRCVWTPDTSLITVRYTHLIRDTA